MASPGVAIIDSGGANIASLVYALQRLGVSAQLTTDAAAIDAAERVILPGVGAAADAMARLRQLGLVDIIRGLTSSPFPSIVNRLCRSISLNDQPETRHSNFD